MTDRSRLFLALWPDDSTRNSVTALLPLMQGRRVPPENLHITMAFLGRQDNTLVPPLREFASSFAMPALTLQIDRFGYFRKNRIAWAGMRNVPPLLSQARAELVAGLVAMGVPFNAAPTFRPHVTLARDAAPPPDTTFEPIQWAVQRVVLVSSVSLPGGVRYEIL